MPDVKQILCWIVVCAATAAGTVFTLKLLNDATHIREKLGITREHAPASRTP
jgi:hypothetical protein